MVQKSFDAWKAKLKEDCALHGKLPIFYDLGDYSLRLFWEDGCEPSILALSRDGDEQLE